MSGRPPLLLIGAGGTGGHMFPAQALAEVMLGRGWRVNLSTDRRGARFTDDFPDAVRVRVVETGTFHRGSWVERALVPVWLATGTARTILAMRRDPPRVVAGFGGYPAFPALAAAGLTRTPAMIHEQNGVLGRVNRLFARRADRLAVSVWPMELPAGTRSVHTGNPVRKTVRDAVAARYRPPDAGSGPVRLLVIGGSQGASVLSSVVPTALTQLPESERSRLQVAQQCRPEDVAATAAAYRKAGIVAEIAPFFPDVPERLAGAQLVISRAGASSVAEIAAVGRPAILVPFAAAIRDEQTANAKSLAAAGGAVVFREPDLNPEALATAIGDIIGAPERAEAMAEAARSAGRPDAAESLALVVEELAGTLRGPKAGDGPTSIPSGSAAVRDAEMSIATGRRP